MYRNMEKIETSGDSENAGKSESGRQQNLSASIRSNNI